MWQKVVTFCTICIAIASAATYTFTTTNPLANHLNIQTEFECAPNEPCVIQCQGNGACDTGKNIKGPGAAFPLTIIVHSDTNTNLGPYAFASNVLCAVTADCSALYFYVTGDGTIQVGFSQIYIPDTGVTIFDCSGNAISSGNYACHGLMLFYGPNGLGDKVGQVKIVDTSATPGRININRMQYTCTSNNGFTWHDQCNTMTWNNNKGYLECSTVLSCQVTDPPTPAVPVVHPIAPAPKTVARGSSSGFVTVWEVDYYIMRLCQGIVVIAMFVLILKMVMAFIRNCNKQKRYSYSKVIYNTDVTDEES